MVSTAAGRYRHSRAGYLIYRDAPSSSNSLRSFVRSLRRLEWSRIGSALLALLIGLTLTLVCQGHLSDNHLTGPHLAFLGGLDHSHHAGAQAVFPDSWDAPQAGTAGIFDTPAFVPDAFQADSSATISSARLYTGQLSIAEGASASGSTGANLVSAVSDPPLESASIATLSYILLLSLLQRGLSLRPLDISATARRKSQTGNTPEPPPPRG